MRLPLVQVALADPVAALASPDRSPDVPVEIVEDAPAAGVAVVAEDAPAARMARMAWSVLANLPERDLLDPRTDRLNQLDEAAADYEATTPVSASNVNVA